MASVAAKTAEPASIVSLVPSDTYSLIRLGLGDRVVARTKYCVEPAAEVADIETVGGTKNANVDRIIELAPDLVVANQEENRKKDIELLQRAGVNVLLSFPKTVGEGLAHAERLAALWPSVDTDAVIAPLRARLAALAEHVATTDPLSTFVPIWMDPLMTIHGDTFISDAVAMAGGHNVFAGRRGDKRDTRYPRVTLEEVERLAPELVLLPDEPHEFTNADADVFRALSMPGAEHVRFCDGKDLMWYGLRTVEGLDRIAAIVDAARSG